MTINQLAEASTYYWDMYVMTGKQLYLDMFNEVQAKIISQVDIEQAVRVASVAVTE